jgi:PAS domain S-box-containing protein
MSLKTRLRIAIVALVAVVVIASSTFYLYDFTRLAFEAAAARAGLLADQVNGYVLERIEHESAIHNPPPASLEESKKLWTDIVRSDPDIAAMLKRSLANADVVVNISITGEDGKALAASSSYLLGHPLPETETFESLRNTNPFSNLWDLLTKREDYSAMVPLGVPQQKDPVFRVTVVIRSVLLRHALEPALSSLTAAFLISLMMSIVLAWALPNVALSPLESVSKSIDLIRTGEFEPSAEAVPGEAPELANVQSKLSLLGRQFRGARQDALELRRNVEHLLQRLDEAVLLFDPNGHLMMAGEPAERLLGHSREEILGRSLQELFPGETMLGSLVMQAVRLRRPLRDKPVTLTRDGVELRLLVNVDILRKGASEEEIGTLVTLRDAETRRQLQLQLDVSSRLAAIGRLTAGVAHEIKNPLNAMALHLEVLKSKLDGGEPEIEVIGREIKRLDTVVKTFLSFNKPMELQARPIDLSSIAEEVITLVAVDARRKNIELHTAFAPEAWINGDSDLLKQAILNVVVNAVEALKDGGRLSVQTERNGEECQVSIADSGQGIPLELQDKIFNLYFTTKEDGSGIGLAMSFRVVQLHSGTIDFVSKPGQGTTFRLRFPELVNYGGEALSGAEPLMSRRHSAAGLAGSAMRASEDV